MKKSVLLSLLFVCALSVLVYCLEPGPHDFKQSECGMCHQGDPGSVNSLLAGQFHRGLHEMPW